MKDRVINSTVGVGSAIGAAIGGIPGLIVGGVISCFLSSTDALPSRSRASNRLPDLPPLPELPGFHNNRR